MIVNFRGVQLNLQFMNEHGVKTGEVMLDADNIKILLKALKDCPPNASVTAKIPCMDVGGVNDVRTRN